MGPDYFFEKNSLKLEGKRVNICLFLDFDGTLVPIQNNPGECVLSPEVETQLAALAASEACSIAVLSGRSLSDIKKRVHVDGICHGGNHGLIISGPGIHFVHPEGRAAKNLIETVRRTLEKEISTVEGAWIEDKEFTFTLHYRQVPKSMSGAVSKMLSHALSEIPEKERLTVLKGKKVLELAPSAAWDKGKACLLILDTFADERIPVYVGDDLTDESAFKALAGKGITVRVGPSKKTTAKYYLKNQGEILRFLREIGEATQVRPEKGHKV